MRLLTVASTDPVEKLRGFALQLDLQRVSNVVLDDPRFPVWSGASKLYQHHYGKGGLAQHTFEVVDLCFLNNDYFPKEKQVALQPLFLAALFHDAGKMWDYEPVDNGGYRDYKDWTGSSHKRLIHHISRSALVWDKAASKDVWISNEMADDVLHAILAHHGQREWGSPVAPKTRLAWLLHLCDGISARMDDADRWDQIVRK